MAYPETNLLPIDIHFIKENLTDRIQVKNIETMSMQEICIDITDLVKDKAEFNLIPDHRVYFTFNQLSRLSDPEIKERTLAKSYPNAMRILSDEIFHILNNYVTIPGTIYEIYMIEMIDNSYITRHVMEPDEYGRTYEYNLIVNLFNDIINKIPGEERLLTYAGASFKTFDNMTTMKLTSYNSKEITQWIYNSLDEGCYIVDLREINSRNYILNNDFKLVIVEGNSHYTIRSTDIVVKADKKIFIVTESLFKELFIPSPYGEYNWDRQIGSVIRRNENYTSYIHYDIRGMIKYLNVSTDQDNPFPTEEGNWEGINIVVPKECTDQENYPKIYIDDIETPIYEGMSNIPVDQFGRIKLRMKFSENKLIFKHIIKWSESHSDTVVFDATNATILTKDETVSITN